jgi:GNAT superfamily N-acetyltransferase
MQSLAVSYFKRYKMEAPLAGLPAPVWPAGYRALAWTPDLLDAHADVLSRCFEGEVDTLVFPSLGSLDGCRGLMIEITRRRAFIPEATWLAVGPDGPCGSVQALRERGALGAIQNIGILPPLRGRGLGQALLLQALAGMYASGLGKTVLEVTVQNDTAIRLYARLGFRRSKVVYKAISESSEDRRGKGEE